MDTFFSVMLWGVVAVLVPVLLSLVLKAFIPKRTVCVGEQCFPASPRVRSPEIPLWFKVLLPLSAVIASILYLVIFMSM